MATTFSLAKSTAEVSDILQLRLQVFRDTGRKPSGWHLASGRLSDAIDADPETLAFIAYTQGKPAGGLRASPFRKSEALLEGTTRHFDMAEVPGRTACIDMLAVRSKELVPWLLKTAQCELVQRGFAQSVFACPLELADAATSAGFRPSGSPVFSRELGQEILPVAGSPAECVESRFSSVLDSEILRFQEAFYTAQFESGEIIVLEGEKSTSAYLIEQGEVDVLIFQDRNFKKVGVMKPGQLIGELALLTNEPRIASMVATTKTTCMAFDRVEFLKLLNSDPSRSLDMFKIFQRRLQQKNQRGSVK